jgi:mannose-6-phosphate isomerase-like protein (cupin superfamily)
MQSTQLKFGKGFRIVFGNRRAQAAEMTIPPGDAEGGVHNRHAGADQWLFVVAGRGRATVAGGRVRLKPGTLLLIAKGQRHEIRNDGDEPLRTLNFYTPPAYRADGEERPAGKSRRR